MQKLKLFFLSKKTAAPLPRAANFFMRYGRLYAGPTDGLVCEYGRLYTGPTDGLFCNRYLVLFGIDY